jgi:hypothetical protein
VLCAVGSSRAVRSGFKSRPVYQGLDSVYSGVMSTMNKDFLALAWDIYRTYEGSTSPCGYLLYKTREDLGAALSRSGLVNAEHGAYRLAFSANWIKVTFIGIDFANQQVPRVVQMAQGIGCTITPRESFTWEHDEEESRCRNAWQLFILPASEPYQGTIEYWLPPYSLDLFEYSLMDRLAGTDYGYKYQWIEGEYHLLLTGYQKETIESAKQLFRGFPQVQTKYGRNGQLLDVLLSP